MNKEIDVRHVLSAVRVPTLIIRGIEEDTIVPAEVAAYMASGFRLRGWSRYQVRAISRSGEDATRLIADEVERFLKEVWDAGS